MASCARQRAETNMGSTSAARLLAVRTGVYAGRNDRRAASISRAHGRGDVIEQIDSTVLRARGEVFFALHHNGELQARSVVIKPVNRHFEGDLQTETPCRS